MKNAASHTLVCMPVFSCFCFWQLWLIKYCTEKVVVKGWTSVNKAACFTLSVKALCSCWTASLKWWENVVGTTPPHPHSNSYDTYNNLISTNASVEHIWWCGCVLRGYWWMARRKWHVETFLPKVDVHCLEKKWSLQYLVDKITPFVDLLIWWLLNTELKVILHPNFTLILPLILPVVASFPAPIHS